MFITPAYAAEAGQAAGGTGSFLVGLAPMLIIFVIFYFLLIRPQQKRMKAHQTMLGGVQRGNTVVTNGGLIGRVTRVDETEVEVELAPNVRVKVVKGMLAEVRPGTGKAANDEVEVAVPQTAPRRKSRRSSSVVTEEAGPDLTKPTDRVGSND